jgi:hypothetical protein
VTHTLIITGQDDLVADGPISYTVRLVEATSLDPRYNQSIVPDLVAINLDNDAAGITVAPASDLATTELGGTDSFTIALNSAPISPVTVTLASGDSSEGTITPTKAVFTPLNWKVAQNITVTGVDDELDDGDIVYAINTHPAISNDPMYSGLNADDPRVINRNNDFFVYVPLIVLSPPPCTEAPEPGNNTAEGAGILRVNAGICAKSFVGETVKNNDYYALTLEAPAAVTLRLKNTTGAHDLDLYLYDSAKTRLAYSINSGQLDETITQSLSAGTYFVRVYWYEATANAPAPPSYALTAVTTP